MWKMPYYARRYETPATYAMIAIMVAFFLIDFFGGHAITRLLLWMPSVGWLKGGQYWQPFTFPFVHGNNIWGLFADGLILYFMGGSLERAWGTRKFLFFFFSSGILAGIVLIPQSLYFGLPIFVGMAGSFVALAAAFAAINPYATIIFYFIPMQARWLALIIVAWELFGNYGRYGGPFQAVLAIAVVSLYGYLFATRRPALPNLGVSSGRGPSIKERFDRWQQRRRMRQWQRRVSKIDRPEDLFKDK
jgi:rhomboid family protein